MALRVGAFQRIHVWLGYELFGLSRIWGSDLRVIEPVFVIEQESRSSRR
jgi:hypothetical protein